MNTFEYTYNNVTLKYTIISETDKTVSVTKVNTEAYNPTITDATLTIPEQAIHNSTSYTVIEIGINAFNSERNLTSITIPNTIRKIDHNAFQNCSGITTITIPASVTEIGDAAFKNCAKLREVSILAETPPTLEGNSVFPIANYYQLTTFDVPNESYLTADGWSTILNSSYITAVNVTSNTSTNLGLITGKWNFISGVGQNASLLDNNTPVTFVSGYSNSDERKAHCDVAILDYNYTENNWTGSYLYVNDMMSAGEGYFVWAFNESFVDTTLLLTTTGTTTNVDMTNKYYTQSVSITKTNSGQANTSGNATAAKWFAFGNPYSSSLSKSNILNGFASNTVQGNILYTYNRNNNNWQLSTTVLAGQGFMVASTESTNDATLTWNYNNNKIAKANAVKSTEENNFGIKFTCKANNIKSRMYAKQVQLSQDGFDTQDAYALFGNDENLVEPYFVVEGKQIVLNTYNSDTYICDVNFHAHKSSSVKLTVSDVPQQVTVSLIDIATGEETILEDSTAFCFDVEQGENAGRYKIKIQKGALSINNANQSDNNISIWNNNENIFIKGNGLQSIDVLNTFGQNIYTKQVGGNEYDFYLNSEGVYIVRVHSLYGSKSHKIVIIK